MPDQTLTEIRVVQEKNKAKRYEQKQKQKKDKMKIIKDLAKKFFMCFYNLDCKVAIENPVQSRIFELPKHDQEIQPYEFGHPYTKKTRLWLKGLPKLKPTNIIDKSEVKTFIESGTSRYKNTNKNKNRYVARGSKDRSKFWSGIAQAMAQQWGNE